MKPVKGKIKSFENNKNLHGKKFVAEIELKHYKSNKKITSHKQIKKIKVRKPSRLDRIEDNLANLSNTVGNLVVTVNKLSNTVDNLIVDVKNLADEMHTGFETVNRRLDEHDAIFKRNNLS
jgi:hypothetical protein